MFKVAIDAHWQLRRQDGTPLVPRLTALLVGIQQTGTLQPIHIWLAILAGHVTRFALSYLRFAQGRWRGISVDVGRSRAAAGEA